MNIARRRWCDCRARRVCLRPIRRFEGFILLRQELDFATESLDFLNLYTVEFALRRFEFAQMLLAPLTCCALVHVRRRTRH